MANNTKVKNTKQTDEEKYQYAETLRKAVKCLTRDIDKAQTYEDISKIYESLGDYENSRSLYEQCTEYVNKHREIAGKTEKKETPSTTVMQENVTMKPLRKIILILLAITIIACISGTIYLKTKPGRYTRASFFQKVENYEKSYKMFHNLGNYKDSSVRSRECKYQYGLQCKTKNDYINAKNTFRDLGDYKESESHLTEAEIENIRNAKIGDSVLYGSYKWLILEKNESKVFLIKSEPINGYAYHNIDKDITWENCTLRKYLNDNFLSKTFCDEMIERIVDSHVSIPDNTTYKTIGGKDTTDKLFLLNGQEADKYKNILNNFLRDWWLITPGKTQNTAQFVSYGKVMNYGYQVTNTNINIRPAMWLSIK